MVFIAAGMGGGTGTGASPVIAKVSREIGALTVAVVTKPFFFEGAQRSSLAEGGLRELKEEVDAMIVIPNDRLLNSVKKEVTLETAFSMSNDDLKQAVEGISDLINMPGVINLDFADIKAVMSSAGSALMGIGQASGEKRAESAARMAINSPLLDISINGAKGVLFAIAGGGDMTLYEIHEAAKIITESIDKDAKVIFGSINDSRLGKGEVKVTVIATGFPQNAPTKPLFPQQIADAAPLIKKEIMKREELLQTLNPLKPIIPLSAPTTPAAAIPQNPVVETIDLEDDPWETIPSFLRRPKGQK
jgi:cell division protein FtsZ